MKAKKIGCFEVICSAIGGATKCDVRLANMLGMVHHLIAPPNDCIGLTQNISFIPWANKTISLLTTNPSL
jgi:hypothetical protein